MCAAHPRVVLGIHRSRHERRLLTGALDLGVNTIDTSFNYRSFTSHTTLADIGRGLLPRFTVSTKVGYFPSPHGAVHSLDPARLRTALERTSRDLGQPPDLVFLHNPEVSACSRSVLADACAAMADATTAGLCGSWGIASWNPRPLVSLIDSTTPKPSVLMVRTGLLVGADTLDASETLAAQWALHPGSRWGMSPFGGSTSDPVWNAFDPRLFLQNPQADLTRIQAAFRTAYQLPHVAAIAVGTDEPAHLSELLAALDCSINERAVQQSRQLLRDRTARQPV